MKTTSPFLLVLCLATITVVACGNQSDSTGGAPTEGASGDEATTEQPAEETPPPQPLKARILGDWTMSLEAFLQTAPPDKRGSLLVVHYSFRDADPTEEELEAAGIKGVEAIGIGLMRQKRTKEPNHPSVLKGMQAYEQLAKMSPNLEVTATDIVIVMGSKRMPSSYTITEEHEDRLVVRSVDGNDPTDIDILTITMPDEHSLRIVDDADEEGGQEEILNFRRQGAPAPAAPTAPAEPDLRAEPGAARLMGRWNSGNHGVSFNTDGVYTLHGVGGDTAGHYRVTSISGNELMLRTSIDAMPLASDRIRVVFTDDTHVTWTNLGSNSTGQYVKQ